MVHGCTQSILSLTAMIKASTSIFGVAKALKALCAAAVSYREGLLLLPPISTDVNKWWRGDERDYLPRVYVPSLDVQWYVSHDDQ